MAIQVPARNWWTLTRCEKWETMNPNGRPKKGIALCNEQLKKEWYEPATRADIEENYMSLLGVSEEKLKQMAVDKDQPMLIRIIAKNMLDWKAFDVVEKMLDRWIWKAVQREEVKHSGAMMITKEELSPQQLQQIASEMEELSKESK